MAIGNYRTATEVTRPARRDGGGAGMLRFGGAIPRLAGAGEGFRAMARMGDDIQRLGVALSRKGDEIADRDAAEAAQKLQAELGEEALGLYQRQGTSAAGIADEWTKIANERVRDAGAGMDSVTRERLKERMAPWLAGRRENLMGHQMREVRRGRIMELENDMAATAANETNDILAQARGEEEDAGTDFAKSARGHLVQLGVVTDSHEDRFGQAVKDGLFSPEEAERRRVANRGNTVRTMLSALVGDGRDRSASAMLDELEGNKGILAERCGVDAKELARFRSIVAGVRERRKAEAEAKEREEERKALDGINLAARDALADGSLGALEAACGRMGGDAKLYQKGSRLHVAAIEAAKRLDQAADAEAKRTMWDSLVESGGKAPPPKGTRAAKFYAAMKASYDEQAARWAAGAFAAEDAANREMRRSNEAALRAQMLVAAKLDPGGFSARIADAAEKGHISLGQYRKIRDEFAQTWRKEGMPEKAAALVDVLKREFFAGKDYDLNDRLGVNPKTGKFEYGRDPDTKKPFEGEDAEFETTVLVPYSPNDWLGFRDFLFPGSRAAHYETRKATLTSDEQIQLLNSALKLAQHDGAWISTDPLTGDRLEKPRQLNAVQEFQNLCSKMKTGKGVAAAQDTVAARAEAQLKLNAAFAGADEATVAKAAKREAEETKAREAARQMRRAPFAPKMPSSATGAATEGRPSDEDDNTEN